MRSSIIALGLALAAAAPVAAQTPEDSAVAVVNALFDGMRARDTAAIRATFDSQAVMLTTGMNREGQPFVGRGSVDDFVASIGRATVELDERLSDIEVRRDAGLATVWTYYDFFADGNFSHCGYDAFMLGRTAEGWKIIAIADTRRREGCKER